MDPRRYFRNLHFLFCCPALQRCVSGGHGVVLVAQASLVTLRTSFLSISLFGGVGCTVYTSTTDPAHLPDQTHGKHAHARTGGNQANRSYANIEAKYAKGKKKLPAEPSDEEFAVSDAKTSKNHYQVLTVLEDADGGAGRWCVCPSLLQKGTKGSEASHQYPLEVMVRSCW